MRFGDILTFRKDLFFEGAVQADWFYQPEKAALVAENFVFHGSEYYGAGDIPGAQKATDTVTFTREIASKVSDDQPSNSLSLAIAGYGTGKSHLAVTLATLLSGRDYQPKTYSRIISNIQAIDSHMAQAIKTDTERQNLVIVLNGMRDFNLHYELLKAAQRSLKLYNCDTSNLRKLNRAIETASGFFERNAHSLLSSFEANAPKFGHNETGEDLVRYLQDNLGEDETAFDIINAVYQDLNGHEIRWDEGVSASSILETLMSEYCGLSGPFSRIVIIFDEFGRYLEYASSTNAAHSGDSALQQIFESVQNYGGDIQVVAFIQADIKAYLQRVDQSSNISRYIGRYDAGEKYRLSSNLETIFANLVQRKDKAAFERMVVSRLDQQEERWQETFQALNRWISTTGLWRDYSLFRKVAVEGVYPMHPLSTYMLSKLSDYLQNRSSLMLLSRYIEDLSELEIAPNMPLPQILPEMLLSGDLFMEMLTAEEEGRQVSQHCIRYNNAVRKYGDKLTEDALKVLRANLALRILRCRTVDREDVVKGLSMFSGLDDEAIESALLLLENEYAVLGYDEHAACFDFLEDSSGAHDFKTFFRRLRSTVKYDDTVFELTQVRELAGVLEPQGTNFAQNHKIISNEWGFDQELLPLSKLNQDEHIKVYQEKWNEATSCDKKKGRLVWLYSNKETTETQFERVSSFAKQLNGMPILLMQIHDSAGLLENALCDYMALGKITEKDQNKFGRHYLDKLEQTENAIRASFDALKKERTYYKEDGVEKLSGRLATSLTDLFEKLYPAAIPFDFDGFDSKQNSKARKAFCSIVKLVLSEQVNENTVHAFSVDVRNRFDATLFVNGASSWKIISADYHVMPPANKQALTVYNKILDMIPEGGELKLGNLMKMLSAPPYGMNEYSSLYMLMAVFANMSYCLRALYKGVLYSISNWKDQVIADNKINLKAISETVIKRINTGAVADQFSAIFSRINSNMDFEIVDKLEEELNKLLKVEKVPDQLAVQHQLAKMKLQEGYKVKRQWDNAFENAMKLYDKLLEKTDIYAGLQCLHELSGFSFFKVFQDSNYAMSETQKQLLEDKVAEIRKQIEPYLVGFISQQKCGTVENMPGFKSYMKRFRDLLEEQGYAKQAILCGEIAEKELSNKEIIRERQELRSRYNMYNKDCVPDDATPYTKMLDWKDQGTKLLESIEKYMESLGKDGSAMQGNIRNRISILNKRIEDMKAKMNKVYEDLDSVNTLDGVHQIVADIDRMKLYGIPEKDMNDYLEIRKALMMFLDDVSVMIEEQNNRQRFQVNFQHLYKKYSESEMDFDVLTILEGVGASIRDELKKKDDVWSEKHLTSVLDSIGEIHTWLQDTAVLPTYLSDETRSRYLKMKKTADDKLSQARIDDILHNFSLLSENEKIVCFDSLKTMV